MEHATIVEYDDLPSDLKHTVRDFWAHEEARSNDYIAWKGYHAIRYPNLNQWILDNVPKPFNLVLIQFGW